MVTIFGVAIPVILIAKWLGSPSVQRDIRLWVRDRKRDLSNWWSERHNNFTHHSGETENNTRRQLGESGKDY